MKTEGSLARGTRQSRLERTALVVSRAILRCHTEEPVLNDTCRLLVEEAGCKMAWIGQAEDERISPVAQSRIPPDYRPPQGPPARALDPVRLALKEDRPRVVHDLGTGEDHALEQHANRFDYASQCAVPVHLADGPGVLVAYSQDPQAFQTEEVALLWEIAGDLEHGMRRLREMALREQQEQELAGAKAHYDLFYEHGPVPMFMTSTGGRITAANHAFARMLGRDQADDVVGKKDLNLYTIMTPPDKNRLFDLARDDDAAPMETMFFRNDHTCSRTVLNARLVHTEEGPRIQVFAQELEQNADARSSSAPAPRSALASLTPPGDLLVHRLNNAMTPILNHAELALVADASEKDRHLRAVQEAAWNLARSIKGVGVRENPARHAGSNGPR